ncbi:EF-P 5-aminopentanol modification-associated protein YfmF [Bacillus massiliglaciei]|uniref:EF-P 5-aminopentanol modification-associated protein YfmF n=1 Tax=Bacillus massiliglaciei TaxID=1816693 RepID=UPI000AA847F6|nr:pitrilysin family protein [Bacillus massiliglaciei]
MAIASENITAYSGYNLHTVQTAKYKTNTLVLKMMAPLEEETVTYRALLPHVLQASTANYPSTSELRSYLDDLYGANFYADVAKKGDFQIITFTIDIANEEFLSDRTPLLEKAFALLSEVIFKPNLEGNAFQKESFMNEARALRQRLHSISDDKMRYSAIRLVEEMCKDERYALDANGRIEDLEHITPEGLFNYYHKALSEDKVDLYVIGDIQLKEVKELAEKYFVFEERSKASFEKNNEHQVKEEKEIIERTDVKQGKLNIGYRTNVIYGDPDYYALQVFNGLFGGFSHSKLFLNVREKASLAYYASSRLESHKGLLMVMSGIENDHYGQALDIIREQLEAMKRGEFTEEEIQQTKAVIKNQILETVDVSRGLVEILYHNVISGKTVELDEWMTKTDEVTKEEIIKAARKIEPDTIYFLTGKEAV